MDAHQQRRASKGFGIQQTTQQSADHYGKALTITALGKVRMAAFKARQLLSVAKHLGLCAKATKRILITPASKQNFDLNWYVAQTKWRGRCK
jgi:hypothetical protein